MKISSTNLNSQTVEATELKVGEKVHLPQPVKYHMSHVMCHVSHVTCPPINLGPTSLNTSHVLKSKYVEGLFKYFSISFQEGLGPDCVYPCTCHLEMINYNSAHLSMGT